MARSKATAAATTGGAKGHVTIHVSLPRVDNDALAVIAEANCLATAKQAQVAIRKFIRAHRRTAKPKSAMPA